MTLVCPSCNRAHGDETRFCEACGVPLVPEGGPAEAVVGERGERARKVKKQYTQGELVRVAVGRQLPEAELIQNILLEEGVPSTLRRTRGFDVPEMLAAGPRDVLVPQSGLLAAREVLLQADMADREPSGVPNTPRQVLVGLLVAVAIVFAVAVLIDSTT